MRSRTALLGGLLALVVVAGAGTAGYRYWRHVQAETPRPAPSTAVVVSAPPQATVAPTEAPRPTPLPPSVFVKVTYTSQSPFRQWGTGDPHQEYCEAAALLMEGSYFGGDARDRFPPAEADAAMARIVSLERSTFPGVLDLPLAAIGRVGTQMYGLRPTIAPVDLQEIERNLAEGRPVILPVMTHGAGGQKISPHYGDTNVYHVILVTGYDASKGLLYTNDAGFTEGQNYAYPWTILSSAIDAQAQKFPQGRVMLVFARP